MAFRRKPPPDNVRRVVCVGHHLRGVTTNKRGHVVQFESEQEHTLVLLLERDPAVADYRSQPEVLHFVDAAGRPRTYTPDFQVWRTDGGIELHEVTVEHRRAHRESLREREQAAEAVCHARGWRYVVHTDQTLPSGDEYANLTILAAFRAQAYGGAGITDWWMARLVDQAPVQPRRVLAERQQTEEELPWPSGVLLNGLYHLLWHGVVQMDWQQPFMSRGDFHPSARIWWAPTTPRTHLTQAVAP